MYRCVTCTLPWDDERAHDNEYHCTRRCGGRLVLAEPLNLSELRECNLAHLPYPAALTASRLDAALHRSSDILKTLFLLKDCFEATLKTCAAILLAEYRRSSVCTPAHTETLLNSLMKPSLGTWLEQVIRPLSVWLVGRTNGTGVAHLFATAPTSSGKRPVESPLFQECKQFVSYRNDALGHGARRRDAVYEAELQGWLPMVRRLLDGLAGCCERGLVLVEDTDRCTPWMGPTPGSTLEPGTFPRDTIGHFVLRLAEGVLDLDPFLCHVPAPDAYRRLHFYDSLYRYKASKKEATVLEYDLGQRHPRAEPIVGLEEAFSAELLERAFRRHRGRMEIIEGRVANFGELIEAHAAIVGRRSVIDHVRNFLKEHDRGLLVIEGQPGKGKTALMAHLIEDVFDQHAPQPVHFFYRRTAGITDPNVCVRSLYHALLATHGITEAEESRKLTLPEEVATKLSRLLVDEIAPRLLPGRPQLILVDALDEADANAFRRLPENLPAGVFVIVTTRPVADRTSLARRDHLHWYDLDSSALEQENLRDGFDYVQRELAASEFSNETLEEIARTGDGNFLVLKLLCEHLRVRLPSGQVAEFLRRLATDGGGDKLGFIYEEFWGRLTDRCSRDEVNLLCDVAGVLVTAHAPVTASMVCGVLDLRAGDWDFALRHLAEYLTVIQDTEEGSDEAFYRIYHESFAEFVRNKVAGDQNRSEGLMVNFCLSWLTHEESYSRRYITRFGLLHFNSAQRHADALDFVVQIVNEGTWEELANLVEAMHQLQPSSPGLVQEILGVLRSQSTVRGKLIVLIYMVWRMPTIIANPVGVAPSLDRSDYLVHWVLELAILAIEFIGLLSAIDYLSQDEATVSPLRSRFRELTRPTLGRWAAFQQDYYAHCVKHTVASVFPRLQLLSVEPARDINRLQRYLVQCRNQLAHSYTSAIENLVSQLNLFIGTVEEYFQIISVLAEGQLMVLQERLASGQGRFQIFVGPKPRATDTVDLLCPLDFQIGEVCFSFGDGSLISLHPFVLVNLELPFQELLVFKTIGNPRTHEWEYRPVESNRWYRVRFTPDIDHDLSFESVCRRVRAEWRRHGRPPTVREVE